MKAVPIDDEIYLIMNRFEAIAVFNACGVAEREWSHGHGYARKAANMCSLAAVELRTAILSQKSQKLAKVFKTEQTNGNK